MIENLLGPRPPGPSLAIAAAVLAFASCFMASVAIDRYLGVRRLSSQLQQVHANHPAVKDPRPTASELDASQRWRAMRAEISFSWSPIFQGLERTNSPDIELLEFVPDKSGQHIDLAGEAHNDEALIKYLSSLSAQPVFCRLHLTHWKPKHRANLNVVTFQIRASLCGT